VIAALRSGDPEQRARAGDVLRRLPWYLPTDPPDIQSALQSYGAAPGDEMRATIISRLANEEAGAPVLLRLLVEEPSELIRWLIVSMLVDDREISTHRYLRDAKFQKKLRELDVTQDDPPVLVVCAKAWLERDRARALGLFRRAVDSDQSHPASDHGVLAIAYDELIANHIRQRQFDQALVVIRQAIPRDASEDANRWRAVDAKSPNLAALVALHRYFGPISGLREDTRTWHRPTPPGNTTASAERRVFDLMTELGTPPLAVTSTMVADRFDLSPEDHLAAGDFLYRNKLLTAAELELQIALAGNKEIGNPATEFNTSFLLGRIAAEQNRDAEAATFYERCLGAKLKGNFRGAFDDDLQLQIHFRRARVAEAKKDIAAANLQVQELVQLSPNSSDDTIAVIRWLKETHRAEQAKAIFDKVFEQSKAQLEAEEYKAGWQNDLAWLCARCDERLDLAVEMSRSAIEAMPEVAAFLDTAAEANYRKGNFDEAVRLESRALELSPGNDFMHEQLQRFKSRQP
jgi:tetratricopeptide (TPR) repeat protein